MEQQWDLRQQRFARLNKVLLAVYLVVTLLVFYQGVKNQYSRAILYSIVSLIMLLVPKIVEMLLKITIPADSRFLFYLFCFGAVEFGSAMDGYDLISWWDLLLHGLSGMLIGFVGLIIFNALRGNHGSLAREDLSLALLFINLTATTSAAFWEYYEFVLDQFFGFNAQLSAFGVSDTITDMMICTLGGFLLSLWLGIDYIKGKDNLLLNTLNHFYYRNRKDSQK